MPTAKQEFGASGEILVAKSCSCPKCKKSKTFKRLPPNFKCADVICDFCGFLAQVKAINVENIERVPTSVLGAAWGPQNERMSQGIYMPLYLVLQSGNSRSIFYLPTDLQLPEMFKPRRPLSETAKRAGWQGFMYDFAGMESLFVRLI
jgi:type II restriction enzyme